LGSFYLSTTETLIKALVSGGRFLQEPSAKNQAGKGIGIMGEVYCLIHYLPIAIEGGYTPQYLFDVGLRTASRGDNIERHKTPWNSTPW
jgi:hypothetical protein